MPSPKALTIYQQANSSRCLFPTRGRFSHRHTCLQWKYLYSGYCGSILQVLRIDPPQESVYGYGDSRGRKCNQITFRLLVYHIDLNKIILYLKIQRERQYILFIVINNKCIKHYITVLEFRPRKVNHSLNHIKRKITINTFKNSSKKY